MKQVIAMGALMALLMTTPVFFENAAEIKQSQEAHAMRFNSVKMEYGDKISSIDINNLYTVDTAISDVVNDPVFGDYGRLIFPVNTGGCSGKTLGELRLIWYSNIDPNETVAITNYMKEFSRRSLRLWIPVSG